MRAVNLMSTLFVLMCVLTLCESLGGYYWPGFRPSFRLDNSSSYLTTYMNSTTENAIHHMEMDLYEQGSILFAGRSSVKTTNGTHTNLVAGHDRFRGYEEDVGGRAEFYTITGFHQVSRKKVAVVDSANHCIRMIDRDTRMTERIAGRCTYYGYSNGANTLFNEPHTIIPDHRRKGTLLITDKNSYALRHLDLDNNEVSTFYRDSKLHELRGVTQEPCTGDLFMATWPVIYHLVYDTLMLTELAGFRGGRSFNDGSFLIAGFSSPTEIVLIDGGRKLLVSDATNDRVRVLDRERNVTYSLCSGVKGRADGDLSSCELDSPSSLLVDRDTLYIGDENQISQVENNFTSFPWETTTTARQEPTGAPTEVPQVAPCGNKNISTTIASGEESVDVEIAPGQVLRLQSGDHVYMMTSPTQNCTVHISVFKEYNQSQCPQTIQRIPASESNDGVLDVICGDITHKLTLPIGSYDYQTVHSGYNCSSSVKVTDYQLVRRLNIKAEYSVSCDLLTNPVAYSTLTSLADTHFLQIEGPLICDNDCGREIGGNVRLSCVNNSLSILWPTNQTYSGDVTDVPSEVYSRLTERLRNSEAVLNVVVINHNPPVVLPSSTDVVLTSTCQNNKIYVSETDSCE